MAQSECHERQCCVLFLLFSLVVPTEITFKHMTKDKKTRLSFTNVCLLQFTLKLRVESETDDETDFDSGRRPVSADSWDFSLFLCL